MGETYRIMEILGEPDETLRWILLKAASRTGAGSQLPVGYPQNLEGDLSRFAPFFPSISDAAREEHLQLLRLYAFIT